MKITDLCDELVVEVFDKLPIIDLIRVMFTCKMFMRIAQDDHFWRKSGIYKRVMNGLTHEEIKLYADTTNVSTLKSIMKNTVSISNLGNASENICIDLFEFFQNKYNAWKLGKILKDLDYNIRSIDIMASMLRKKYPASEMYDEYKKKSELSHKKYRDSMRDHKMISFHYGNNKTIRTTITKLSFFKWFIQNCYPNKPLLKKMSSLEKLLEENTTTKTHGSH